MNVAFTIGLGSAAYRKAACITARALAYQQNFQGQIIVFSDRDLNLPDPITTIIVDDERFLSQPKWLKVAACEYINVSDYEKVLFLDGDVITQRPVDDILALADQCMVLTDDVHYRINQGSNSRCFNAEELLRYESHEAVTSSFFAGPGKLMQEWLSTWKEILIENQDKNGRGFDQSALNKAILENRIPVKIIPDIMWWPRRQSDGSQKYCNQLPHFIHYHNIGRKKKTDCGICPCTGGKYAYLALV
jgi:lipopolysaccharide biosynthesis glycosyltransferase